MIRPKAGHAIVELEQLLKEQNYDGIIIPDSGKQHKGKIGKVIDLSLYPEGKLYGIYDRKSGKLKGKEAWHWNGIYEDIIGRTVLMSSGIGVSVKCEGKECMVCRLEHIEAILPHDANAEASECGIRRCSRCKSSGEGNIIMYHKTNGWFCPKCGKNAEGYTAEQVGAVSSRDFDEAISGERRRSKGTIFSFASK